MTDSMKTPSPAPATREEWAAAIERSIRTIAHPEDRFPADHPARALTAQEKEEVSRLARPLAERILTDFEMDGAGWLDILGPIPSRRREREVWVRALPLRATGSEPDAGHWANYTAARSRERALRAAVKKGDWLTVLHVVTESTEQWRKRVATSELRHSPEQTRLQEIRDALEQRIDDALEECVEAAVRSQLDIRTGDEAWEIELRTRAALARTPASDV